MSSLIGGDLTSIQWDYIEIIVTVVHLTNAQEIMVESLKLWNIGNAQHL